MGKNHRRQKRLKSKCAKTKLKGAKTKLKGAKTKFLSKEQNKTKCVPKGILLQQQLKSNATDELLRKLTLKDLLTRLQHHNVLVKSEACKQLRDLICAHLELRHQDLWYLFTALCPLFLEREKMIRREAVKVLKTVLHFASLDKFEKFFQFLSWYLRQSMTHIDVGVQKDSLVFLDCLLEHVPALVAQNGDKILKDFFTLICQLRNDSKPGRTLTLLVLLMTNNQTSVKWRIKVLSRLQRIFEAILLEKRNSSFYRWYPIDFLAQYGKMLLPFLYETWIEAIRSDAVDVTFSGSGINTTILKQQAATTLNCILNVFYLLLKLSCTTVAMNRFHSKASWIIVNALLKWFPYSRVQNVPKLKGRNTNDVKCIKENLLLCDIIVVLNITVRQNEKITRVEEVLDYLNYCFMNWNYVDSENVELFMTVLKKIYMSNFVWNRVDLDMRSFIHETLHFCKNNKKIIMEDGGDLLYMLYNIMEDCTDESENLHEIADQFVQLLLEPEVSVGVIDSVLLLAKENALPIQYSLRNHLDQILENLHILKINNMTPDEMEIKKWNLFFCTVESYTDDDS